MFRFLSAATCAPRRSNERFGCIRPCVLGK